ncbi:MAG TPA: phage virion morphogenesis protein [Gaiellaceae bacterium]
MSLELSPPMEFIEAQFGEFGRELTDFTGLWERFADTLQDVEHERFATEGFGEWPPLAPSTIREKTRLGFPLTPLVRTGLLEGSLTRRDEAMRLTPQSMSWGTDVPYAKYHQGFRDEAGTPTDEGRPPVRKVLDIRVEDRRRLEASMVGWINEIAARTLGRVAA